MSGNQIITTIYELTFIFNCEHNDTIYYKITFLCNLFKKRRL